MAADRRDFPDEAGLAALRATVTDAWVAAPSRFREDANAEEALQLGGYADRAIVELAANGVDAAQAAGVAARVHIAFDRRRAGVPAELRVANTGAGLTADGLVALASLRASAKRDDDAAVGHFGVGFTAVLALADVVRVISATGGVRFDRAATATAVRDLGDAPLIAELEARDGFAPALRLPWPLLPDEDPLPAGFDTEVRLTLRPDVDLDALDRWVASAAEDLFWALPDLAELITPEAAIVRRSVGDHPTDGLVELVEGSVARRFRVVTRTGRWNPDLLRDRPIEERGRVAWRVSWVLPLRAGDPDGAPPPDRDVLADLFGAAPAPAAGPHPIGAPTATDEQLGLAAMLVGSFPVDDTRRRIVRGPLTDELIDVAAAAYLDLVAELDAGDRLALVPPAGFPHGDLDARLRTSILHGWQERPLLRSASGGAVAPRDARFLPGLRGGTALLGDVVPGLLPTPPDAGSVEALRRLGVSIIGASEVVTALGSVTRPPDFWRQVYAALADFDAETLSGLPVPLVDGRQLIGPRGRLLPDEAGLAARAGTALPGLAVVHPDAVHPVLARLGAVDADPGTLLESAALLDEIRSRRDDLEDLDDPGNYSDDGPDDDPDGVRFFAELVGDLVAAGGRVADRRLEAVILTDEEGRPCPAAELSLPDADLRAVTGDALAVVGDGWVRRWGADVVEVLGVRSAFRVVGLTGEPADLIDDLPDLDDYAAEMFGDVDAGRLRAAGGSDEPGAAPDGSVQVGIADLDLVEDDCWVAALAMLAADRDTRAALIGGHRAPGTEVTPVSAPTYSAWWIRTFARIDGRTLSDFRRPGAADLAGLYDVVPVDLDTDLAAALGVRSGLAQAVADDPSDVLGRLADPDRSPEPARVAAQTAAVVAALAAADQDAIRLPDTMRTVAGTVADADQLCVPDGPWWAQVLGPDVLVAPGGDPQLTADVLDLALASELVDVTVPPVTAGRQPSASEVAALDRAAAALSVPAPRVGVVDGLTVAVDGTERPVQWWPTSDGFVVDGSAGGVGRAVAWSAGRWAARHRAAAAAADDVAGVVEDDLA